MQEIWKDIKDYEGFYQVSNLGNVKSLERKVNSKIKNNSFVIKKEKILKKTINKKGYEMAHLSKKSKTKNKQVHRLVAEAFIPNPDNLPEVNHKDENPLNNNINNLEWCDRKHNINWGTRTQRAKEKMSKKINMYNLNNEFIKQFSGINEASRIMNISTNTICLCCQGKRNKAGGYKWKYSD